MRNEELTRVEGSGIDCRTVGACWLCGVHDKRSKPAATVAAATMAAATCREIVGLAKFRGWTRCRKNKLDLQVVGFQGGVEGCGGQAQRDGQTGSGDESSAATRCRSVVSPECGATQPEAKAAASELPRRSADQHLEAGRRGD